MNDPILLLADRSKNGCGLIHANRHYLNSLYCWGEFDGARVAVEASPDGKEWFETVRFEAKDVRRLELAAPYLRGRIEQASGATRLHLLLL